MKSFQINRTLTVDPFVGAATLMVTAPVRADVTRVHRHAGSADMLALRPGPAPMLAEMTVLPGNAAGDPGYIQ